MVVKLLLARGGVNVNFERFVVPLVLAAAHESALKLLLARDDVDVNLMDING